MSVRWPLLLHVHVSLRNFLMLLGMIYAPLAPLLPLPRKLFPKQLSLHHLPVLVLLSMPLSLRALGVCPRGFRTVGLLPCPSSFGTYVFYLS